MYTWKCWIETRPKFYMFLILVVGAVAAVTWAGTSTLSHSHDILLPEGEIAQLWESTARSVLGWGGLLLTVTGLGLGSWGLGHELSIGTAEFLLTKPKSRKYFVWTGWAVVAVEIIAIVFFTVVVSFLILFTRSGSLYSWRYLLIAIPLGVIGLVVLTLTYFLTIVTKSDRNGLGTSLAALSAEVLISVMTEREWNMHIPTLADLTGDWRWVMTSTPVLTPVHWIAWACLSVAFLLFAQLLIDRVEV